MFEQIAFLRKISSDVNIRKMVYGINTIHHMITLFTPNDTTGEFSNLLWHRKQSH